MIREAAQASPNARFEFGDDRNPTFKRGGLPRCNLGHAMVEIKLFVERAKIRAIKFAKNAGLRKAEFANKDSQG